MKRRLHFFPTWCAAVLCAMTLCIVTLLFSACGTGQLAKSIPLQQLENSGPREVKDSMETTEDYVTAKMADNKITLSFQQTKGSPEKVQNAPSESPVIGLPEDKKLANILLGQIEKAGRWMLFILFDDGTSGYVDLIDGISKGFYFIYYPLQELTDVNHFESLVYAVDPKTNGYTVLAWLEDGRQLDVARFIG